jgi:hypothetical protein
MTKYNFIFCGSEYRGMMWGVIADSRANIPSIINGTGWQIKDFVDAQITLVGPGVGVWKIETGLGVLAGYLGLYTGPGQVGVVFLQVRPAFESDLANINQNIGIFVNGNAWAYDVLN